MRRQEASKRRFARSNMAAAAAGGCLRQRGGAETARVTSAGGERCARGRGKSDRRLAWTEAEGAGLQDLATGNEMRSTGSRVALMIASVRA